MHTLWSTTLSKISKTGATRCQIQRLKCTKFDFCWGSATDPAGGAYCAPPDILAEFKGPLSKEGGERDGKGGEAMEGKERGRVPTPLQSCFDHCFQSHPSGLKTYQFYSVFIVYRC